MSLTPPLTKALFQSAIQCGKRLYLEYHEPDTAPAPDAEREYLAEVGTRLLELARESFPQATLIEEGDHAEAVERTTELLAEGRPMVLYDAAFSGADVDLRVDILIHTPAGLDIFEVKSGTRLKQRYLLDVALQIHVLEANGHKVRSASLLHLDGRYRHPGGKDHDVQKLFKSVDVTERARRHAGRVDRLLAAAREQLADEGTLELPTGTHCKNPFDCPYFESCLEEGPEHPLIQLPELTRQLEYQFHVNGIEELDQIELDDPRLSPVQRRALLAVQEDRLVVEDFVAEELGDVDFPLFFFHVDPLLEVLPRYEQGRPWHKIPYLWSLQVLEEDDAVGTAACTPDGRDDPRVEFLRSLARAVQREGTLIYYGQQAEARLRAMLEEVDHLKTHVQFMLNLPYLDLMELIRSGVYHPAFAGSFDLDAVADTLLGPERLTKDDIEPSQVNTMLRKMVNTRTRQQTREKLGSALEVHALRRSRRMLDLYRHLRSLPAPA